MGSGLIETGRIVNTHGMRGELRVQPWADSLEFLTTFDYFYIDGEKNKINSAKPHKNCVIVKLDGIDDIDAASRLKGKTVSISRNDIILEEGTYLIADLIGLKVIDAETGNTLGTITDILTLPANNVYVIKDERSCPAHENPSRERPSQKNPSQTKEILIPAVPEFIIETNLEQGYVKARLLEGL